MGSFLKTLNSGVLASAMLKPAHDSKSCSDVTVFLNTSSFLAIFDNVECAISCSILIVHPTIYDDDWLFLYKKYNLNV